LKSANSQKFHKVSTFSTQVPEWEEVDQYDLCWGTPADRWGRYIYVCIYMYTCVYICHGSI
jgi:hypothetical protein